MLADGNGLASPNGTGGGGGRASFANGSSSHTNGTHKTTAAGTANGSSQNGKQVRAGPSPSPPPYGSGGARERATYFGHDREEVTRILLQALSEMGYHEAAESVSRESGYDLESPAVAAFRSAVLEGSWVEAEHLLFGNGGGAPTALSGPDSRGLQDGSSSGGGGGLVLVPEADRSFMRFLLRQQKFLELLENRDTARALMVLRTELQPLYQDTKKLHFLSSLLMCQNPEDLKAKANWDGAYGQSRSMLLSQLSKYVSPSVMLPEHRLAVLLQQVKDSQVHMCMYHTTPESPSLYSDHKCDRQNFPSEVIAELDKHFNEVWHIAFSHDGTRLASAGADKHVIIWDVATFEPLHTLKEHGKGIGKVAWSPDDTMIVTCCSDHYARLWDTETGKLLKVLDRFDEPVSSCAWAIDGQSFFTGSFDLNKSICHWDTSGECLGNWGAKHRVGDLVASPDGRILIAMDDQMHIYVYDLATLELRVEIKLQSRPLSVSVSQDGVHVLVNKVNGEAQLIDLITQEAVQKYVGFMAEECIIRSGFGGANESFVVCGSDDGTVSIWHKSTGLLVQRLDAHQPRCNTVAWNPTDPCMFATCGDDCKVKIWSNRERLRAAKASQANAGSRSSNGWRGDV